MVGPQDAFAVGEDLLVEFGCLPVFSEAAQCGGEVVAAGEGEGVVGSEGALDAREDLLVEFGCLPVFSEIAEWVLLADPQADGATLAAALGGASASRTSDYRKAAHELIAQDYPEHDPDLTTTPTASPTPGPPTRSSSWTPGRSWRPERTTNCWAEAGCSPSSTDYRKVRNRPVSTM